MRIVVAWLVSGVACVRWDGFAGVGVEVGWGVEVEIGEDAEVEIEEEEEEGLKALCVVAEVVVDLVVRRVDPRKVVEREREDADEVVRVDVGAILITKSSPRLEEADDPSGDPEKENMINRTEAKET